jgi:hypothetical protein
VKAIPYKGRRPLPRVYPHRNASAEIKNKAGKRGVDKGGSFE